MLAPSTPSVHPRRSAKRAKACDERRERGLVPDRIARDERHAGDHAVGDEARARRAEEELLVGAQRERRERVGRVLGDDARGACARLADRPSRRCATGAARGPRAGTRPPAASRRAGARDARRRARGRRRGRSRAARRRERSAGAWRDRRWRGRPARTRASAVSRHDGREAGPRDGVVVQRERGEHEAGRGQQRPAAAARERRRQCDEAGARRSCRRRRSRRRSPGRSRRPRPRARSRQRTALDAAGDRARRPQPEQRRAIRGVRAHGAIFTSGLSARAALDRTLLGAGPHPPIGGRSPAGRRDSEQRAERAHVRCRRARARRSSRARGVAWRTSSQRDRLQRERAARARPPRAARRRARAAGARPPSARAARPNTSAEQPATTSSEARSSCPVSRRGSARARLGPGRRAQRVGQPDRGHQAARPARSPRARAARLRRSIMAGASRGDPRSSAATRPGGSTTAPRRGRRP